MVCDYNLKLNSRKTNVIIFAGRQKEVPATVRLGDSEITVSENVRNLGFIIDCDLNFQKQIDKVCRNAYLQLRIISRNKYCMNIETMEKLLMSQVMSHLNFCCLLYCELPEYLLKKLQQVQNCAVRLLKGISKRDHITPHIKDLKWLTVKTFIKLRYAVVICRCINGDMPGYLTSMLKLHLAPKNFRSNYDTLLELPRVNKNIGSRSFSHLGPKIWNEIPKEIKHSSTLNSFRSKFKLYLLDSQ